MMIQTSGLDEINSSDNTMLPEAEYFKKKVQGLFSLSLQLSHFAAASVYLTSSHNAQGTKVMPTPLLSLTLIY